MMKYRYLAFLGVSLVSASGVQAAPWEEVIPKVAERAAILLDEAERRGYPEIARRVGDDAWTEFHRDSHNCAILGRMLGVPELIEDQERMDIPGIQPDEIEISDFDVIQLYAGARSLETWVEQAEYLISFDLPDRVDIWNETCTDPDRVQFAPTFVYTTGPGFADFPTQTYLPDGHPVIEIDSSTMSEWEIERYLPHIQAGLEEGPNFAGKYSVVALSCGTSCRVYDIKDAQTGESIAAPFGGEATPEIDVDFNVDSQLIYARHMGETSQECALRAWHFDGSEFTLKHAQVFPRGEVGCNPDYFRVIGE